MMLNRQNHTSISFLRTTKVILSLVVITLAAGSLTASARSKKPDYGVLEITTSPDPYPLLIDGAPSGTTAGGPRRIELAPGAHTVEIQFPGGARWVRDFEIVRNKKQCITLNYKPREVVLKTPCPTGLSVSAPEQVTDGDLITFASEVSYAGTNQLSYTWTISPSNARITSGAGTNTITVDTTGLRNQRVSAALLVDDGSGDPACRQIARASTRVIYTPPPPVKPRKFDEFPSISFDDDKARLDNLAIEMQNDPNSTGYVIVYGGRTSPTGAAEQLGNRALNYLEQARGIDPRRLVVVEGGYRETPSFELWIVPQGATAPEPTPTLQPGDVRPKPASTSKRRSRRRR